MHAINGLAQKVRHLASHDLPSLDRLTGNVPDRIRHPRGRRRRDVDGRTLLLPAVAAAGALAAFLYDPALGRGRRALIRQRGPAVARRMARRAQRAGRTIAAGAYGTAQGLRHRHEVEKAQPNDATLARKVETMIFRAPDVPKGDIVVNAEDGRVVLRGVVPDRAMSDRLEREARAVVGVRLVENLLHLRGTPAPSHAPPIDAWS
jgi:hypothetical protein